MFPHIVVCSKIILFILVLEVLAFFCVLLGTGWAWSTTAKATAAGMKLQWEA